MSLPWFPLLFVLTWRFLQSWHEVVSCLLPGRSPQLLLLPSRPFRLY